MKYTRIHSSRKRGLTLVAAMLGWVMVFSFGVGVGVAGVGLWEHGEWRMRVDGRTGAVVAIAHRDDPERMNWVREAGRWDGRDWVAERGDGVVSAEGQWGLVETAHSGLLHVAGEGVVTDRFREFEYRGSTLSVVVRRGFGEGGEFEESYTFRNTGNIPLELPLGSVSIQVPLFDQYPDSRLSLTSRCHVHLWMGGGSAWVNAVRMGGLGPHLGMVVTGGSLDAYSQRGVTFNDRGVLLLHPGAMRLARGESKTVSWKWFWHRGWDEFFGRLGQVPGHVRMTAERYVVEAGKPLELAAESLLPLDRAEVLANGRPVGFRIDGGKLRAEVATDRPGEVVVELRAGGRRTWLRAHVTPPLHALVDARVRFIVGKQQRLAAGDPLDGAYLSYDNETGQQVHDGAWPDHNAGRERLAMGVLGALYLPMCKDAGFRGELKASLDRYAVFLARELVDEKGVVYDGIGRKGTERLYNFPWAARFYLAMWRATGEAAHLDRFVAVMASYYRAGGLRHYGIGVPVGEGLRALAEAGRGEARDALLEQFKAHADALVATGVAYPRSEVNFEQAIVAPAVQIAAEVHQATGGQKYLEAAREQMVLLDAFCGRQPDHRLHGVAVRHWDAYWFGKTGVYGDTMPHYWSVLNAVAYAQYGRCTGEAVWMERAEAVFRANLSLFQPDGSASCAHLAALSTNGQPAARNDPWANDQDWALVEYLAVRALAGE